MKTASGNLEPEDVKGEAFALRTEDDRFTSLLGGSAGGVLPDSIGVVDPAGEKATEPFECETAAEPGREIGVVVLESRDVERLLERRRNQERG